MYLPIVFQCHTVLALYDNVPDSIFAPFPSHDRPTKKTEEGRGGGEGSRAREGSCVSSRSDKDI